MVGAPGGDLLTAASSAGSRRPITNKGRVIAVSAHEFSRRTGLGFNTAGWLRAGKRSRHTAQTMLAIQREFGWPVAEQAGAVAEGRYTREINERVFQTEEGAA
jgi:hypothetical protein